MNVNDYPVSIVPLDAEDGEGYMAYAVDLPGCMSHGETPAEALASIYEAIEEWVLEAQDSGQIVPAPGAAVEREKQFHGRIVDYIKHQDELIEAKDALLDAIEKKSDQLEKHTRYLEHILSSYEPLWGEDMSWLVSSLQFHKAATNH